MPKGPAVPLMGVWLRREGDHINVYVQKEDGRYYLAISEYYNNNFSHNITEHGLAGNLRLDPLETLDA